MQNIIESIKMINGRKGRTCKIRCKYCGKVQKIAVDDIIKMPRYCGQYINGNQWYWKTKCNNIYCTLGLAKGHKLHSSLLNPIIHGSVVNRVIYLSKDNLPNNIYNECSWSSCGNILDYKEFCS